MRAQPSLEKVPGSIPGYSKFLFAFLGSSSTSSKVQNIHFCREGEKSLIYYCEWVLVCGVETSNIFFCIVDSTRLCQVKGQG